MADKHQAFVFESYPNKRQLPNTQIFFCFSSLSGIDLTPQVNLKHFFFLLLLLTFAHVDQIVPCVKFTALKSCTLALCPEDVTAALGLLCLSYSAC